MTPYQPVRDYRKFRFGKLNTDEFGHLKLLLYWPVYGIFFYYLERVHPVTKYHVMYCPLDDMIPFCEYFMIPYMFWFIFLIGIHVYTLLYDIEAFRKLMKYIIITYSLTIVIFVIFPTSQELRPAEFPRDNAITRFISDFYKFDTNTNVCPSLHVIGSYAVVFTAWNTKRFSSIPWKIAFGLTGLLISISTVFLKQHSVIDIIVGFIICFAVYFICFPKKQAT